MSASGEFTTMVDHFIFGSNSFLGGQDMTVVVDDVPLIRLERRSQGDGQLLLTADLYNEGGVRLGRVNRNTWVASPSSDSQFEATASSNEITMTNTGTGDVLLHAEIVDKNTVVLNTALLFGASGTKVDVTTQGIRFYKPGSDVVMVTLGGNTVTGSHTPIRHSLSAFGMG